MYKVKDITMMGAFLSLIVIGKLIDLFLPHLPTGLDEATAVLPLVIVSGSILLGFKRAIFPILLYVFGISWIGGGVFFMQPLTWVPDIVSSSSISTTQAYFGIYFLDYVIPLMVLIVPSLLKTKKSILIGSVVAIITNYLSHVISGYVIWSSFGSMWGMAMIAYSFVGNGIRMLFLLLMALFIIPLIIKNRSLIVQDGYINDSFKEKIDGVYYQKRVPKFSIANWENEKKVYENLGIEIDFRENGVFYKKWIKGSTVKMWSKKKLTSLKEEITLMHSKSSKGIIKHEWSSYNKHASCIPKEMFDEFINVVKSFNKHKQVLSHNDINGHNVLWNKKNIILIDFEWSRVNTEYYDYAQFHMSTGIDILPEHMDKEEYIKVLKATRIHSLLWTYSIPESKKSLRLRKKYQQELGIK